MVVMRYTIDLYYVDRCDDERWTGICFGESYSDIVNKLETYYTCSTVIIEKLELECPNHDMEGDPPDGLYEIEQVR